MTTVFTVIGTSAVEDAAEKDLSANDVAPNVKADDPLIQQNSKDRSLIGKASELFNNKKSK